MGVDLLAGTAAAALALYEGLPAPVCLVGADDGRLRAMNPRAAELWGLDPAAALGRPAVDALGIVPADGRGEAWSRLRSAAGPPRLACRIRAAGGEERAVLVVPATLDGPHASLLALFVIDDATAAALAGVPAWALRDPVSGLGNRTHWEREVAAWSDRAGVVVFFDLDDLKEVNDLHGHVAGDRTLAAVGGALAAAAPPGALTVRYGGDEFVALLPSPDAAAAERWAEEFVRRAAAASAGLPIVPRLSHGVAGFEPGGLRRAVQEADDALYERKGVLLRASGGGRLILTRVGRAAVRGPGEDRRSSTEERQRQFGPDYDRHFRAAYARADAQASAFCDFAAPAAGEAAVEVGAGSGRLTFDGGLARRIGVHGQLLVTDPAGVQLQAARRRAEALHLDWLRFIRAPAEELPLASHTADLVIGAHFLHLTAPVPSLREMARLLRPGGRVAVCAPLPAEPTPGLARALEPLRRESARLGLPPARLLLDEDEVCHAFAAAGLRIRERERTAADVVAVPTADAAVALSREVGLVPRLLRALPQKRHAAAQNAFEMALRASFAAAPDDFRLPIAWLHVLAEP